MKQLIVTLLFIAVLSCNANKDNYKPTMIIAGTDTLVIEKDALNGERCHDWSGGWNKTLDTFVVHLYQPAEVKHKGSSSNIVIVNGDTLVNNSKGNDVHVSIDGNDVSVEQH